MDNLRNIASMLGIDPIRVNALPNSYSKSYVDFILNKYGIAMLGILIVMAEKQLPIDFATEVTQPDGNCYMHALKNQTIENKAVIPHLTHEQIEELNMDKVPLRRLWCETGKGYFAGKWESKVNIKGQISDKDWQDDWKKQSQDGTYDGTVLASDLFIMVPPHRLKRHILVIDSQQEPPIKLLDKNIFCDNSNDVSDSNPFILAHTRNHYQSMIPSPGEEEYWRNLAEHLANNNRTNVVVVNTSNSNTVTGNATSTNTDTSTNLPEKSNSSKTAHNSKPSYTTDTIFSEETTNYFSHNTYSDAVKSTRSPSFEENVPSKPKFKSPMKLDLSELIQKGSYECSMCNRSFQKKKMLNTHLKSHKKVSNKKNVDSFTSHFNSLKPDQRTDESLTQTCQVKEPEINSARFDDELNLTDDELIDSDNDYDVTEPKISLDSNSENCTHSHKTSDTSEEATGNNDANKTDKSNKTSNTSEKSIADSHSNKSSSLHKVSDKEFTASEKTSFAKTSKKSDITNALPSQETSYQKPNISEQQKYPEFIPTFEFQELQNWQRVPVGCITQMNLQTGKKYCKLDPNYLKDPFYGMPACLRKEPMKVPTRTPGKETTDINSKFSQDLPNPQLNSRKRQSNINIEDTENFVPKTSKNSDTTNSSPFECDKCQKPFQYKSKLDRHLKTHEKDNEHCTPSNKTNNSFENLSDSDTFLKKDMPNVNIGPYKCTKCPKIFSYYSKLLRHLKTHEN